MPRWLSCIHKLVFMHDHKITSAEKRGLIALISLLAVVAVFMFCCDRCAPHPSAIVDTCHSESRLSSDSVAVGGGHGHVDTANVDSRNKYGRKRASRVKKADRVGGSPDRNSPSRNPRDERVD